MRALSGLIAALLLALGGYAYQYHIQASHIPATAVVAKLASPEHTEAYLRKWSADKLEALGSDFYNPRYAPERIGKKAAEVRLAQDYDFARVDELFANLKGVERSVALQRIFQRVTGDAATDRERHLRLLHFLQRVSFHSMWLVPVERDGQAIYDPLVLLELGEMQCGQVSRLAVDLWAAGGKPARVVQAGNHVFAELFYDDGWHYLDADIFGGGTVVTDGSGNIPSVDELSKTPYWIDAAASYQELAHAVGISRYRHDSREYPSYHYFSRSAYGATKPSFYVKTATAEQAAASRWFGWNYYRTEVDAVRRLFDGPAKYEPGAVRFTSVTRNGTRFTVSWQSAADRDGDLLGYRVFVGSASRGWDYQMFSGAPGVRTYWHPVAWNPRMYDAMFRLPPSDAGRFETKSPRVTIDVPAGQTRYVSVMPYDRHGESVGRVLYSLSEELVFGASVNGSAR